MRTIFMSFADRDAAFANEVKEHLMLANYEFVFLDFDKMAPIVDENWEKRLYDELSQCDAVILVLTPNWLVSKWCFAEMAQARALGKFILPLVFADLDQPFVATDIPPVDLTQDASALPRLLVQLERILASPNQKEAIIQAMKGSVPLMTDKPKPISIEPSSYERTAPEYWLNYAGEERQLPPSNDPMVLLSFAAEDQRWVDDIRAFLEPRIEHLRTPRGRPYHTWDFSDAKRGTSPGDEFPIIVAEKMWTCRVALLVLSKDYFRSRFCRTIELPFLMWRRERQRLMCLFIKLGALPTDKIRLPNYNIQARTVFMDDIIDDRQAPIDFSASRYRDLSLKQLREDGIESEIENRFEGLSRRVVDFLKREFSATDT
jgi:TIR domain